MNLTDKTKKKNARMMRGAAFAAGHQAFTRGILNDSRVRVISRGKQFYNSNNFCVLQFLLCIPEYFEAHGKVTKWTLADVRAVNSMVRKALPNDNKIVIASTPAWVDERYMRLLNGGILHECAHSLYTTIGYAVDEDRMLDILTNYYDPDVEIELKIGLMKKIWNIFEDAYIERKLQGLFRGALPMLQEVHQFVWDLERTGRNLQPGEMGQMDDGTVVKGFEPIDHFSCYLRDRIEHYLNGAPLREYNAEARDIVDSQFAEEIADSDHTEDTYDTLVLAFRTMSKLNNLYDQQAQQQQQGQHGQGQPQSGQQGQQGQSGQSGQQSGSQNGGSNGQDGDQKSQSSSKSKGGGQNSGPDWDEYGSDSKGDSGDSDGSQGEEEGQGSGEGDDDASEGSQDGSGGDSESQDEGQDGQGGSGDGQDGDDSEDGEDSEGSKGDQGDSSDSDSGDDAENGNGQGSGDEGDSDSDEDGDAGDSKGKDSGDGDSDDDGEGDTSEKSSDNSGGDDDNAGGGLGNNTPASKPRWSDEMIDALSKARDAENVKDNNDAMQSAYDDATSDGAPPTVHPYSRENDEIVEIKATMSDDETRIYTEMMDRTREATMALRPRMLSFFRGQSETRRVHRQEKGRRLGRTVSEVIYRDKPRPFQKKTTRKLRDSVVSLVLDESGSMSSYEEDARMILASLALTIGELRIPHEVIGFTSSRNRAVQLDPNDDWYEVRDTFSRIHPVRLRIFRKFDEPFNVNSYRKLTHTDASGVTPLPDAIEFAGSRIVTRKEDQKIMFVVTDGQPCYRETNWSTHDYIRMMHSQVDQFKKMGVEVLFVGVGYDASYVEQFENSIHIAPGDNFAVKFNMFLMEQMRRLLVEG